jgi:hypothetical protein
VAIDRGEWTGTFATGRHDVAAAVKHVWQNCEPQSLRHLSDILLKIKAEIALDANFVVALAERHFKAGPHPLFNSWPPN